MTNTVVPVHICIYANKTECFYFYQVILLSLCRHWMPFLGQPTCLTNMPRKKETPCSHVRGSQIETFYPPISIITARTMFNLCCTSNYLLLILPLVCIKATLVHSIIAVFNWAAELLTVISRFGEIIW